MKRAGMVSQIGIKARELLLVVEDIFLHIAYAIGYAKNRVP